MKMVLYLLFVFMFFLPSTAQAYLDPGTGNALVYVIMSFLGALAFSLKGIFYKLIGKSDTLDKKDSSSGNGIVIFSEGKNYWNTFKPIVESLINKEEKFSYYTMDIHDPCLTIDSPFMNNRYIGSGNMAYVKIGNIEADIVLSTTPNIGTEGYPIPRSKSIKKLVHVFHAFEGLTVYHIGSLDNYDAVLMVGEFESDLIRNLEKVRNLKQKELYLAGLPYLDVLNAKKIKNVSSEHEYSKVSNIDNKDITVLVAPSWTKKGCLTEYGPKFVSDLAEAGYNVILRPHPQSLKVEKEMIADVKNKLSKYSNISWDYELDGTKSFSKADIMISDKSRIRFDFLFLYNKPVITLQVPLESMQGFEMAYVGESWVENDIGKLGSVLDHSNIDDVAEAVRNALENVDRDKIIEFRKKHVANWGNSGNVIADYLIKEEKKLSAMGGNN